MEDKISPKFPGRLTQDPEFVEGIIDTVLYIKEKEKEIILLNTRCQAYEVQIDLMTVFIKEKGFGDEFVKRYERMLYFQKVTDKNGHFIKKENSPS